MPLDATPCSVQKHSAIESHHPQKPREKPHFSEGGAQSGALDPEKPAIDSALGVLIDA
jgi:hypothetical protein